MQQQDYVYAGTLWFILTFLMELGFQYAGYFIRFAGPPAAPQGVVVDDAFRLLFVLGLPVFAFVITVIAYSLLKFRARSNDDLTAGATVHGNNTFSLIWLAITGSLCFLVIVHPGLTGLNALAASPRSDDLVVKVTGSQWAWKVAYPAYGKSSRKELVLPVGQRVRFEVTSTDVVHSFWIPAFREKIDAVPGKVTEMYATPDKVGSTEVNPMLRVQCAEMCGLNHAFMKMPIRIVTPSEFDVLMGVAAKKQEQTGATTPPPTPTPVQLSPAERGQKVADEQGCLGCHSTDGSKIVGPTWQGLFGSQVPLADGNAVTANEDYLRESIVKPNDKIVKGFPANIMPQTFGKTLAGQQIDDLIAYIKSLSGK